MNPGLPDHWWTLYPLGQWARHIYIFTNPSTWAGYDTRSIFMRSSTGLTSEFSFSSTSCLIKAEELSLSYYLPIAGGRIIGFIPFPRVLVLCEMPKLRPGFELVSLCPFPTTINITSRSHLQDIYTATKTILKNNYVKNLNIISKLRHSLTSTL